MTYYKFYNKFLICLFLSCTLIAVRIILRIWLVHIREPSMDILNSTDSQSVLNPSIRKIGNCSFRTYTENIPKNESNKRQLGPYLDNDDDMISCMELEDDIEIKLTKSGKFLTQFHVPAALFSRIIGAKGSRRKEIEMATDTQVKIPRQGETGDIIITGATEKNVASAKVRVQMIALQARNKMQMTHFVAIPTMSEEIRNKFEHFKLAILNGPPLRGVDETIFQTPEKLHLTVAPLVLLDEHEKNVAMDTLHKYKDSFSELFANSGPLKIVLEGLEIMNDDPTSVDVLYANVKLNVPKYNTNFQKLMNRVSEILSSKGLLKGQFHDVKLHVTLMNSKFRNSSQGNSARESFDASYILKEFKNVSFGEAPFTGMSLVIRHTSSEADQFYEKLTTVDLINIEN